MGKGAVAMAMYPEDLLRPMREELRSIGFSELRTAQEVDAALKEEKRTALVGVNSVCERPPGRAARVGGNSVCRCAAGRARPAIARAISPAPRPELLLTVFAGQDAEATAR